MNNSHSSIGKKQGGRRRRFNRRRFLDKGICVAEINIPGVIEPGRLYTVRECRRRLGLGDKSWRDLRRARPVRP